MIFKEKVVTKSESKQIHYPRKLQILAGLGNPQNIIPSCLTVYDTCFYSWDPSKLTHVELQ